MCLMHDPHDLERGRLLSAAKDAVVERMLKAQAGFVQSDNPFSAFVELRAKQLAHIAATTYTQPDAFLEEVMQFLLAYHPEAHAIGQEINTGLPAVRSFAEIAYSEQAYIQGFAQGLLVKDKRLIGLDGELDLDKIQARLSLYLVRGAGSAQHGWAHSGSNRLVWWDLSSMVKEAHCDECPYLAKNGPYTTREDFQLEFKILPTTPRGNDTPCLFNCECILRDEIGEDTSWSRIFEN